jgi:two-component system, chemotaxis family, sensor kinase CheA
VNASHTANERVDTAPTALLIEDEIWVRMEIAHRLRAAGFTVVEAATPEDVARLLQSSLHVDVILMDLGMQRLDGAALLHLTRTQPHHVPIFVKASQLPCDDVYHALRHIFLDAVPAL